MATQTWVLIGVFAYFCVGAFAASGMAMLSYGFTGRGDKMIPIIFFAWPVLWLFQIPGLPIVLIGAAAAGAMTGIAWLIMRAVGG